MIGVVRYFYLEGQNLNVAICSETVRDAIAKSLEDRSKSAIPAPSAVAQATPTPAAQVNLAQDYVNRALREYDTGNYQSAIIDYTEAIQLDSDFGAYYSNRGDCYVRLKQYRKAVSDYTEAIWLYPKSFLAYESRADVYEILGKHSQAEQDRKKAKELRGNK